VLEISLPVLSLKVDGENIACLRDVRCFMSHARRLEYSVDKRRSHFFPASCWRDNICDRLWERAHFGHKL